MVRNLCLKIPRKRHRVSLLRSAANAQHCMHVRLSQPADAPTHTMREWRRLSRRCRTVRDFHVSFAKAWMLMGKGVAHALDYDFRLVPPAVMAWVQRRLEGDAQRSSSGDCTGLSRGHWCRSVSQVALATRARCWYQIRSDAVTTEATIW